MLVWAMLTLVWATPTLHILMVMAMPSHTSASPPSVFMVCPTLVSPSLLPPQQPRNNKTKPNQTKPNHVSTETNQAAWLVSVLTWFGLVWFGLVLLFLGCWGGSNDGETSVGQTMKTEGGEAEVWEGIAITIRI